MARSRSNGGAYAWALVIFGCGFVVSLLIAIVLYTKIDGYKIAAEAAEDKLAVVDGGSEPRVGDYTPTKADPLVNQFVDTIEGLEGDLRVKNGQISDLSDRLAGAQSEGNSATLLADDREAALTRAQAAHAAALSNAQDELATLRTQKQAMTDQIETLRQQVNGSSSAADDSTQARVDSLNSELEDRENEIADLQSTIRELTITIGDYEDRLRDDVVSVDVTTADGKVLSVFSNGDQLFINRGRNQGVMLGLTFEVFEPNMVIRLDDAGSARGKATIEVYDLDDDMSACRVVRVSRGETIAPGDVIANIVYDPNKTYIFYPFGYFDIEFDGGPSDIGRIQNLISQWGGVVADPNLDADGLPELTPDMDFLILGRQPDFPEEPASDELDPVVIQEWQARVREYETYQKLKDEALRLRIPILNQNRFMDLVGYYER